jgi:hypothetical protein
VAVRDWNWPGGEDIVTNDQEPMTTGEESSGYLADGGVKEENGRMQRGQAEGGEGKAKKTNDDWVVIVFMHYNCERRLSREFNLVEFGHQM